MNLKNIFNKTIRNCNYIKKHNMSPESNPTLNSTIMH